jgi:hypothetical protein
VLGFPQKPGALYRLGFWILALLSLPHPIRGKERCSLPLTCGMNVLEISEQVDVCLAGECTSFWLSTSFALFYVSLLFALSHSSISLCCPASFDSESYANSVCYSYSTSSALSTPPSFIGPSVNLSAHYLVISSRHPNRTSTISSEAVSPCVSSAGGCALALWSLS